MKLRLSPLLPIALIAVLSGCMATQADILELENQTDELKYQITGLEKTITSLQTNQADLSVDMKHLREDISLLNGTIVDLDTTLGKLETKIDDLGASITAVGTSLSTEVSGLGKTLKAREAKRLRAAAETKAAEAKRRAAEAAARKKTSPTELYHNAEVRLAKKDYVLAAQGFEAYIANYPTGSLVDMAVYNLGDAHYRGRKWEPAAKQFGLFLNEYPKSKMTPAARLLYALSLIRLKKNRAEAIQYLESIPLDFPRSPEARAAKRNLKRLADKDKKKKAAAKKRAAAKEKAAADKKAQGAPTSQ